LATLDELREETTALWPSRRTLRWVTDKVVQKLHASGKKLPVGRFRECSNLHELEETGRSFGYPLMLKRPRHSYDGYGNATAQSAEDLETAYQRLGGKGSVLVEAWVPYVRELSVIVVRRADGEMVTYPVAYTRQEDHRCVAVEVPAPVSASVERRACAIGKATAEAFDIVGVAAIELFELESGELLFNEIAPRPHNSGHFTIEGCATSQFENHLRAILGWPLGDTSLLSPASVMVNILGKRAGEANARRLLPALQVPRTSVHIYGKKSVRPLRKMGHVTALGEDIDEVRTRAHEAAKRVHL
jgi:5-(carboxyamino)imidazole ribonucleotide synthase